MLFLLLLFSHYNFLRLFSLFPPYNEKFSSPNITHKTGVIDSNRLITGHHPRYIISLGTKSIRRILSAFLFVFGILLPFRYCVGPLRHAFVIDVVGLYTFLMIFILLLLLFFDNMSELCRYFRIWWVYFFSLFLTIPPFAFVLSICYFFSMLFSFYWSSVMFFSLIFLGFGNIKLFFSRIRQSIISVSYSPLFVRLSHFLVLFLSSSFHFLFHLGLCCLFFYSPSCFFPSQYVFFFFNYFAEVNPPFPILRFSLVFISLPPHLIFLFPFYLDLSWFFFF